MHRAYTLMSVNFVYLKMLSFWNLMVVFGFIWTSQLVDSVGGGSQTSTMSLPTTALAKTPLSPINDTRRREDEESECCRICSASVTNWILIWYNHTLIIKYAYQKITPSIDVEYSFWGTSWIQLNHLYHCWAYCNEILPCIKTVHFSSQC